LKYSQRIIGEMNLKRIRWRGSTEHVMKMQTHAAFYLINLKA
jgi:hypothetical protein